MIYITFCQNQNQINLIYEARFIKKKFKNSIFNFTNKTKELILQNLIAKSNFYLKKSEINSGIDIGQDFINKKSKSILGDNFNIGDGVFNLSNSEYEKYNFLDAEKEIIKPFFTTTEINRYLSTNKNNYWVIYTTSKFKKPEEIIPYPNIKEHLNKFKNIITSDNRPYGLHRARNEAIFKGEKILSIRKCIKPSFTFVDFDSYVNRTYLIIKTNRINLKYLVTLFNSKIVKFWLKKKGKLQGELFQVDINPLTSIPIINLFPESQHPFIEKADIMHSLNKQKQEKINKFLHRLETSFAIEKLSTKLKCFYEYDFKTLISELKNKKVKLSFSQQDEFEEYFNNYKDEINELQKQIDKTDKEIDQMVYELYGLTKEEIEIVDGSS